MCKPGLAWGDAACRRDTRSARTGRKVAGLPRNMDRNRKGREHCEIGNGVCMGPLGTAGPSGLQRCLVLSIHERRDETHLPNQAQNVRYPQQSCQTCGGCNPEEFWRKRERHEVLLPGPPECRAGPAEYA